MQANSVPGKWQMCWGVERCKRPEALSFLVPRIYLGTRLGDQALWAIGCGGAAVPSTGGLPKPFSADNTSSLNRPPC